MEGKLPAAQPQRFCSPANICYIGLIVRWHQTCLLFSTMGNKLKRSRHVVEPWCCLSTQLGPSIQLTKQRHSLGAALHSCFWSRCWAAATKAACAIAALRDEDKLQQHPILVFWTLLVPLVLKGMGTARGQAQHPGFLIGVISDHTVK